MKFKTEEAKEIYKNLELTQECIDKIILCKDVEDSLALLRILKKKDRKWFLEEVNKNKIFYENSERYYRLVFGDKE